MFENYVHQTIPFHINFHKRLFCALRQNFQYLNEVKRRKKEERKRTEHTRKDVNRKLRISYARAIEKYAHEHKNIDSKYLKWWKKNCCYLWMASQFLFIHFMIYITSDQCFDFQSLFSYIIDEHIFDAIQVLLKTHTHSHHSMLAGSEWKFRMADAHKCVKTFFMTSFYW